MKTRCLSNKRMSFVLFMVFLIVFLGWSFCLTGCKPKKKVKYDPSDINQVVSAFVTYVREGNKKGLKEVTLGKISRYGVLERDDIEGFKIAEINEGTISKEERELALKKLGIQIPLERAARVNLAVNLSAKSDITHVIVILGMGYSDETKRWYVINVSAPPREIKTGLGVDIRKYASGNFGEFYVYKSPIEGFEGFFPKECPDGYVGYVSPVTGQMGWVPKDINIQKGYVIEFNQYGKEFRIVSDKVVTQTPISVMEKID